MATSYDTLKTVLQRLDERLERTEHPDPSIAEGLRESAIKRFEYSFATLLKVLYKYLHEDQGVSDIIESPIPLFRTAAEAGVIVDAELWINYIKARNDTFLRYDADHIADTFKVIPDFLADAKRLYRTMTGEEWNS